MLYEVDTSKPANLDWGATGVERVLQNVRNAISTFRYEVAYARTRGMDPSILDTPVHEASKLYIAEIYRVVPEEEPRAKVEDVKFLGTDEEGNMQFKVVVNIE
ncbi:MAG: hypothetical protein ACM3TR_11465 [Caulobacteraceae bacterium]